jgi:PilZ domain-containing protein
VTPIEARLGSEIGRLVNLSATGALLQTQTPFLVGRQCPLFLNLPGSPISLTVRIVRTELTERTENSPCSHLVGVMFTEFSSSAKQALARLCGMSFNLHE